MHKTPWYHQTRGRLGILLGFIVFLYLVRGSILTAVAVTVALLAALLWAMKDKVR